MIESTFELTAGDIYDLPDLDEATLREWNSLNNLLSDLERQSATEAAARHFAIPTLLGDGDGVSRWVIVLTNVRNLAHVGLLRSDLTRIPWCIAARVVEIGSREIRVGVTATMKVDQDQIYDTVYRLVGVDTETSIQVQPVSREVTDGLWVTATDAANRLGVKPRTVNHWIELGLVEAKRAETTAGKEWLIRTGQLFSTQLVGA